MILTIKYCDFTLKYSFKFLMILMCTQNLKWWSSILIKKYLFKNIESISGNDLLAVTSDKGNVHVYNLDSTTEEKTEEKITNTKSIFGFMKGVLPTYFSSEWSFAQFKFWSDTKIVYTACAFTNEHKLVLISIKGDYHLLEINTLFYLI